MNSTTQTRRMSVAARRAQPSQPADLACPACGASATREFFKADAVPVFCNVTYETAAEARRAPRGDIRLRMCPRCGYIHNAVFDTSLAAYAPTYENAQHFSPFFRRYAEQLASRLVEHLDLHGKRIIEIGCGDGYFLRLLCRAGENSGTGFDPSHRGDGDSESSDADVSFRAEYYGPDHAGQDVDFICCRHVLEHIADPLRFLAELRETLGGRRHVRLYFEVPNALHILQGFAMWDVLYEHCGYFLAPAMERLFWRAGFEPLSTWQTYESAFLAMVARPACNTKACVVPRPALGRDVLIAAESFADRFRRRTAFWRQYLTSLKGHSRRAVFWQAGSRGVTLLNALGQSGQLVSHVVDVNPRKQGRFVPCSAQQIVAPDFLRRCPPAAVIIMNPVYQKEISKLMENLGVRASLLVA